MVVWQAVLIQYLLVLNAGQQQRLGTMTGVPSGALFNAAGVPGFQGGGKVRKKVSDTVESTGKRLIDVLRILTGMDPRYEDYFMPRSEGPPGPLPAAGPLPS